MTQVTEKGVGNGKRAGEGRQPGDNKRAVVLLSGGLDSATALAIARSEGYECHALSIRYGQRHALELEAAQRVAAGLGAADHRIVDVNLRAIGGSALTDDAIAVPTTPTEGIPATYVPARNTVFLALALGHAEVVGAHDIFVGVSSIDYSGYPDCRPEFIAAFEQLAQLATRTGVEGETMRIHAPLIRLSKADTIRRGTKLGVDYAQTLSCYQPSSGTGGEPGAIGAGGRAASIALACGRCDSCRLRRQGFEAAGIPDPTRYAS